MPEGATALPTEFTRVEFVDDAVSPRAGERLRILLSSKDDGSARKRKQASNDRGRTVLAQSLEVDYLARTRRRDRAPFLEVEFQSTIRATMPSRMLLYRAGIIDRHGDWTKAHPWIPEVEQVVNLYKEPWGPKAGIATGTLTLNYRVVDLCAHDASALLEGGDPADAVISLLCRGGLVKRNLNRMIETVAAVSDAQALKDYVAIALALAKLRDAQTLVESRINDKMPINLDLSGSELLSRPIERAYDAGDRARALSMFNAILNQRFGPLAIGWTFDLSEFDAESIQSAVLRILQSDTVEQLAEFVEGKSGAVSRPGL